MVSLPALAGHHGHSRSRSHSRSLSASHSGNGSRHWRLDGRYRAPLSSAVDVQRQLFLFLFLSLRLSLRQNQFSSKLNKSNPCQDTKRSLASKQQRSCRCNERIGRFCDSLVACRSELATRSIDHERHSHISDA